MIKKADKEVTLSEKKKEKIIAEIRDIKPVKKMSNSMIIISNVKSCIEEALSRDITLQQIYDILNKEKLFTVKFTTFRQYLKSLNIRKSPKPPKSQSLGARQVSLKLGKTPGQE